MTWTPWARTGRMRAGSDETGRDLLASVRRSGIRALGSAPGRRRSTRSIQPQCYPDDDCCRDHIESESCPRSRQRSPQEGRSESSAIERRERDTDPNCRSEPTERGDRCAESSAHPSSAGRFGARVWSRRAVDRVWALEGPPERCRDAEVVLRGVGLGWLAVVGLEQRDVPIEVADEVLTQVRVEL